MATTYKAIATVTVGSGGAANIEFTSIAADWTDLIILCSLRSNSASTADNLKIELNGSTSNFTARSIYSTSDSSPNSYSFSIGEIAGINATNTTASVFSNTTIYICNYASANNKSISTDSVAENNATRGDLSLYATLWSNSSAITSIKLVAAGGNFIQYSTATLYGISNS
jgi:hypothetical protein